MIIKLLPNKLYNLIIIQNKYSFIQNINKNKSIKQINFYDKKG